MNRRYESMAKRGLFVFSANPWTVFEFKPRFNTVSIIPGMDARAPDRTDTNNGLRESPNPDCINRSTCFIPFRVWSHMPAG